MAAQPGLVAAVVAQLRDGCMCGRFTLTKPRETIEELFDLEAPTVFEPRYNIAPSQTSPVLRIDRQGTSVIEPMRWGLVPDWATPAHSLNGFINARRETLLEKPSFRIPFLRQRCLIPADGFYEWRTLKDRHKQPFYISLEARPWFAFAGLWSRSRSRGKPYADTFTIVTDRANASLMELHNRMPVIIDKNDFKRWLSPESAPEDLQSIMDIGHQLSFVYHAVDKKVNASSHEGKDCIERIPLKNAQGNNLELF